MNKGFRFVGCALIVFILCVSFSAEGDTQSIHIGQTFTVGDTVQATIVSVKVTSHVGSDFTESKAAEGGEYVAVVWKYKNISTKPIDAFENPSLTLIDSTGTIYDPDDGASSSYAADVNSTEKILSNLNPGITVTAAAVFEVSKASFNPATWVIGIKDNDDIRISLQGINQTKGATKHKKYLCQNLNTGAMYQSDVDPGPDKAVCNPM